MSHAARSRLIEAQATHLAPPRLEGYSLSVGAKGDTYTIALQQSLHLRRVEDEQALKRTTNVRDALQWSKWRMVTPLAVAQARY